MATSRQNRSNKDHPWSWHRIFLLFALTVIMILGFVVVGGGSAMMSKCEESDVRRAVYLSDIVMKTSSKLELLRQVRTAWTCDIPAERLPPALSAAADPPLRCASDLLTQLRFGAQGSLAAGVMLVVASGGGYGGAISGRSGPLALYMVGTVVTAVLELAAVGLLVYSKSQLDGLPARLEQLMARPLEQELLLLDAPGGILTAPGEVPTPAGGPQPGGTGGGDTGTSSGGGKNGSLNVTDANRALDETTESVSANTSAERDELTATPTAGVTSSPLELQETVQTAAKATTAFSSPGAPRTSPSLRSSRPPADSAAIAEVVESRQATANAVAPPVNDSPTQPSVSPSSSQPGSTSSGIVRLSTFESQVAGPQTLDSGTAKPQKVSLQTAGPQTFAPETAGPQTVAPETGEPRTVAPQTGGSRTVKPELVVPEPESIGAEPVEPERRPRRRRSSEDSWTESEEDWGDRTEEVIVHWALAATDCLRQDALKNGSHCVTQLEHRLQRELKQSELVLELMMAPLVCTFLACLMQLTTLCAAWNIISDRQRRRPRHQTSQQLSTPV